MSTKQLYAKTYLTHQRTTPSDELDREDVSASAKKDASSCLWFGLEGAPPEAAIAATGYTWLSKATNLIAMATENPSRQRSNSAGVLEAMNKLDKKLVAYLGADLRPHALKQAPPLPLAPTPIHNNNNGEILRRHAYGSQEWAAYQNISGIQLHMEALTLQAMGTRRMSLLRQDIRPIFTIECQLSAELIEGVAPHDMFHIMQFESEKFQSLAQCARFGQTAERRVRYVPAEGGTATTERDEEDAALGRLHFTVWWREPGTCLNEMLGMGVLPLAELRTAGVFEQCRCVAIQRRGVHLANVYCKMALQLPPDVPPVMGRQCGDRCDTKGSGSGGQQETSASGVGTAANFESRSDAARGDGGRVAPPPTAPHFSAETSKVRLLKGLIYANETRNLPPMTNRDYFLIFRRFWHESATAEQRVAIACDKASQNFDYREQFSLINDEQFWARMDRQRLPLELWHSGQRDTNGNAATTEPEMLGVVELPLHHFFIAYSNAAMANHLCQSRLPVISVDAWLPFTPRSGATADLGELRCLLAIGSAEQIEELSASRGMRPAATGGGATFVDCAQFPSEHGVTSSVPSPPPLRSVDWMALRRRLHPSSPGMAATQTLPPRPPALQEALRFLLTIECATGLPLNQTFAKGKKKRSATGGSGAEAAGKRVPPAEPPSTYVTFQATDAQGGGKLHKSHEGMVYATSIAERTTNPVWQSQFRLTASSDYLTMPHKNFIMKIWKKTPAGLAQCRQQPTPMKDAIIGFAAIIDLGALRTQRQVGGRLNIVDFNGRITGQLEVRCESLNGGDASAPFPELSHGVPADAMLDKILDMTQLNQAVKRKCTELEGISERLRSRLSEVAGEQLPASFDASTLDDWQPLNLALADDMELDEFERDINSAAGVEEPLE